MCCLTWLTKCSFLVKDFAQNLQRCGDSPVCCLTWFNKCSFLVKVFEQKSHRWGVSPVCHIIWFVKCSFLVKDFPQISHLKYDKKNYNKIDPYCSKTVTFGSLAFCLVINILYKTLGLFWLHLFYLFHVINSEINSTINCFKII